MSVKRLYTFSLKVFHVNKKCLESFTLLECNKTRLSGKVHVFRSKDYLAHLFPSEEGIVNTFIHYCFLNNYRILPKN